MPLTAFTVRLDPFETVDHEELNSLFDTLYDYANDGESVHRDGANSYTDLPTISAESSGSTQMTRYSYAKQSAVFATSKVLNATFAGVPFGTKLLETDTADLDSPWKAYNTASENSLKVTAQAGSTLVTFAAGIGTLTWPVPWTTHVLAAFLTNGDNDAPGGQARLKFRSFTALTSASLRFGSFTGTHFVNFLAFGY